MYLQVQITDCLLFLQGCWAMIGYQYPHVVTQQTLVFPHQHVSKSWCSQGKQVVTDSEQRKSSDMLDKCGVAASRRHSFISLSKSNS